MIPESQLREAARIAGEAILDAVSVYETAEIHVSPRFEYKMRKLIKAQLFRARFKRVIAAVLAMVLIGGSVLITVRPEVAASIWGWLVEKYDYFYHYYFPGDSNANHSSYAPQWLPDEYTLSIRNETDNETFYLYSNESDAWIQFYCIAGNDINDFFVFSNDMICIEVDVGQYKGHYYQANISTLTDALVWTSEENGLLFYLTGFLDYDTLLKIAESVSAE